MREYIKPKLYKNQSLSGMWEITYKIDGVRVFVKNGVSTSRGEKHFSNFSSTLPDGDYEIYGGSWEESISLVRGTEPFKTHQAYCLDPVDKRLQAGSIEDPTSTEIKSLLQAVLLLGHEGLVLRQNGHWFKVKPSETYDVIVLDVLEGKGRNVGRLGALVTSKGNVGTGFTDHARQVLWEDKDNLKGVCIEVECMKLTAAGKFRHPNFKRLRVDK